MWGTQIIRKFREISQFLLKRYLALIRKVLPEKTDHVFVGLDIGSHSCKMVEIVPKADALTVMSWAIIPVVGGNTLEAIKQSLAKIKSRSKNVYTALSGQGTLVRFIKMPRMPLPQVKDSVRLEADKYFPFSKDQIHLDCQIVEDANTKEKDNKVTVLVAVSKRELVKERMDLVASLDLQTNFIGLNSMALANAYTFLKGRVSGWESKDRGIAILDVGKVKSSLVILKKDAPRFTRDIAFAGKDFTQRISHELALPLEAAERLKCQPTGKTAEVLSACQPVLANLASEIKLSFDYFTSENNSEISQLYLVGGGSLFSGIAESLTKELEIPVSTWDLKGALNFSLNVPESEFVQNAGVLAVALGLSLSSDD